MPILLCGGYSSNGYCISKSTTSQTTAPAINTVAPGINSSSTAQIVTNSSAYNKLVHTATSCSYTITNTDAPINNLNK